MRYSLIAGDGMAHEGLSAIEQVLIHRGIAEEDINHFLHTTDDDIYDPLLLDNMREGAQMLIRHISNGDKIFIQIDSDCDGFTSSAALINYMYCLFPAFTQNNVTYRLQDGKEHGIILDTIPEDVKLVIAPDSASNNYEEHEALAKRGIDVLILDHHLADRESEHACVINNQLCDYPTKSLSGVGIVYKFCSYIDSLIHTNHADKLLDLVALGMIADVMSLRDYETKHLINKGLKNLRNPFMVTMCDKQSFSLGEQITPIGIAFYVAPQVNGTIRMGTHDEKLMLFESMLDFKAYELIPSTKRGCKGQMETRVEQACRNCTNIKSHQTKARDAALESIEEVIQEQGLLENKVLMVKLAGLDIERNLTGLIANQLMGKYQRPVLLLNKVTNPETNEVSWEGSGRGYGLPDFRQFLKDSGYMTMAEGHENAFGAGVLSKDFSALTEYCNTTLADYDFTPSYKVDFIYYGSDFNGKDITDLASYSCLWGQQVEEPCVAVEHVVVTKDNISLMSPDKKPTIKIRLSNGVDLIKFKSSQEEYESLYSENGCITLNIVGRCATNTWGGRTTPQIFIEDYEVVSQNEYYF